MTHPTECSCQQFELYSAEQQIRSRPVPAADLQRFVDDLRETSYWERNFPNVRRIECHVRRSNGKGSVGWFEKELDCGVIDMAPVHLTELYVLHEVSHVLASARYGSQAHCPWFARTYLELASVHLPSETYLALQASFDRGGIDYDHQSSAPAGIAL